MPPTFTYPGVYIEEIPSSVHTITGVATSIAAFVGWAPEGPTEAATLVQSWPEYERTFGGLDARSYLGYSVYQFFTNGGQQAYIVRLISGVNAGGGSTAVEGAAKITLTGGIIAFTAGTPGSWSNAYAVQISASTNPAPDFKVSIVYAPQGIVLNTLEVFDNETIATVSAIISKYVSVVTTGPPTVPPPHGLYPLTGGLDGNGIGVPAAAEASITITGIAIDSTVTPTAVDIVTGTGSGITLSAADAGAWGNTVAISVQPRPDDLTRFTLSVLATDPVTQLQSVVENFPNLSTNPADPQARFIVHVLHEQSTYLVATAVGAPIVITNTPGTASKSMVFLAGGNDGSVLSPTTTPGTPGGFETLLTASGSGVDLLTSIPIFNLLIVPGEIDPATISTLEKFAVDQEAFLIVDSQQTDTFTSLQSGPPSAITGQNGINAAFYFPWVYVFDPVQKVTRSFPPSGFVAGLYAATDSSRGVWKAPAGINAGLTGEAGLTTVLTDLQNGTLNVQGINCLRNFRVYGDVVWGARTLRGNDQVGSEWKYVPIRRLALFLEKSLYEGTQWVVFEPNDETLWGQIRLNVGAFMQGLFLQGAFQGTTPQQAYFVKCDSENNPQTSIAQGIVNILVGFAPLYPAEFVVIQIEQLAGQTQ
ncbi:MAG TPA: phage tail sheath subtilisin-like domain-containing protein [Acidisarcina sp.]